MTFGLTIDDARFAGAAGGVLSVGSDVPEMSTYWSLALVLPIVSIVRRPSVTFTVTVPTKLRLVFAAVPLIAFVPSTCTL